MASAKRLWHQKPGVFELAKLAEEAFRQPIHDVQRRSAFLSPGAGDFLVPSAILETVLESTANLQARKPALPAADRTAGVLARSRIAFHQRVLLADAKLRSTLLVERHLGALQNSFLLISGSSFPLLKRPCQNFCIPHSLGHCLGRRSGLR